MDVVHILGDRSQEMRVRGQEVGAAFKGYPLGLHFLKETLPHNVPALLKTASPAETQMFNKIFHIKPKYLYTFPFLTL